MKIRIVTILAFIALLLSAHKAYSWGFFAHRKINRMAIFCLPSDMIGFYKKHIDYISEHAIDPDKRARGVKGEDVKHYIDIDHYGENPFDAMPKFWKDAVAKYTEDTLQKHGINPWWVSKMEFSLMQAFKDGDASRILYYSANIGHYIADATTPLHTTQWYDGKIPAQKGIHAFWETRVPEVCAEKFDFLVGKAEYVPDVSAFVWQLVRESHEAVDTIFTVEEYLRSFMSEDIMYVYEDKGISVKRQFSQEYIDEFNKMTGNQVERRMCRAIHAVASLWYTAWVNAGQPDLKILDDRNYIKKLRKEEKETEKMWRTGKAVGRPNPEDEE